MLKLRIFLKPYKLQLILGPLAKLAEAVLELILPLIMANLIDMGVRQGDTSHVIRMSIYMVITASAGLICALFCQYSASIASQGFGTILRDELIKKINSLSHSEFNRFGVTTLMNRATIDVNNLQYAVAMLIRLVIRAPFLSIGGIIMAMLVDLKLSLVLLVFIPIFILILYVVMRKAIPMYKTVQLKLDSLSAILRENITGIRVIRAFGNSEKEKERFEKSNNIWMDSSIEASKRSALLSPLTLLTMNVATAIVIVFGGIRVDSSGLTQGQLVAFISYITQIMLAMIVVSNLMITFSKAFASAARVNEVLETEPSIQEKDGIIMDKNSGFLSVEFENVSFMYGNSGEYSIKDISFKAKGGQTVGIIGGTGSGKSTLVNLIPRFFDPSAGRILINDIDIKDYDIASLRDTIGVVPQKSVLFTGTIRSNLCFGNPNANDSDLVFAASIAQASEFINRMPEKYDSLVSQGGKNFSGGQKQRLSIARAITKKPKILILDDSASALDYATDLKLRTALKENNLGTTFIVSQRVSAVMNSDFIIVLNEGEIAGMGTHKELLSENLLYREICQSQNIGGGSFEN